MVRVFKSAIWLVLFSLGASTSLGDDQALAPVAGRLDLQTLLKDASPPEKQAKGDAVSTPALTPPLSLNEKGSDCWVSLKPESAEFPKASKIPGTEVWWKFGGFIKADFIHDFEPAGTPDRWVPTTIPVDGDEGQNTLLQAKATRFNLDVRTPSDWGTIRGFVETDFFTSGNQLRIRHAYAEVGSFLAGQTWTVFTDPDGIPRTLDFESPIAFIVQRNPQFRWTESINDHLKWVTSVENPTTNVDDNVIVTFPGEPRQPIPDIATHLKYKSEFYEWFIAGLLRDVAYRPVMGDQQDRFAYAVNLVGILKPTKDDKIIGQLLMGSGLGRYRGGDDLRLSSPTKVETVKHIGGCFAVSHNWTTKLTSNGVYSFAFRDEEDTDPPDTPHLANYVATNLIWAPIDNTTLGVEYLYGSNEVQSGDFGDAHRIQATVQYSFP